MRNKKRIEKGNGFEKRHVVWAAYFLFDLAVVFCSYFVALWLRFDMRFSEIPMMYLSEYFRLSPLYAGVSAVLFMFFHLYNSLWRYAGYMEMVRMFAACAIGFVAHVLLMKLIGGEMPRSYYVFGAMIQLLLTVISRFSYRFVRMLQRKLVRMSNSGAMRRVMLIGGGEAGRMIINDIKTENELVFIGKPVQFDHERFLTDLEQLMLAAYENAPNIREMVMQVVDTYRPAGRTGSEEKGALYEAQMRKTAMQGSREDMAG